MDFIISTASSKTRPIDVMGGGSTSTQAFSYLNLILRHLPLSTPREIDTVRHSPLIRVCCQHCLPDRLERERVKCEALEPTLLP